MCKAATQISYTSLPIVGLPLLSVLRVQKDNKDGASDTLNANNYARIYSFPTNVCMHLAPAMSVKYYNSVVKKKFFKKL